VERSPLLAINPKQIVPIPPHTTQGVNHRYLRFAIETVMVFRTASEDTAAGQQAGADFALELDGHLHDEVRVRPTPYDGGLFMGRDCHTIGDNCAGVCAAPKGKVSERHLAAYDFAWALWNCARKTLNRAAVISADEEARFWSDTVAMVGLIKSSFLWLSISSKMRTLMRHAPDVL